jgi:hypothetical protein
MIDRYYHLHHDKWYLALSLRRLTVVVAVEAIVVGGVFVVLFSVWKKCR